MKFSVLMSVYAKDDPSFFRDALSSVFDQSRIPDEVVLVKDGPLTSELEEVIDFFKSQDGTRLILKAISLESNSGLGIALNAGIKECLYDVVARMDSDDESCYDRFEKLIGYIEKHDDVIIVGSNIDEYSDDMSSYISSRVVPKSDELIRKRSKSRSPFNHVSVAYRKEAVLKAGGYQHCLYFEDYFLWMRMLMLDGQFHNIQESLVRVRGGNSMINRRGGLRYGKSVIDFYTKLYNIKSISFWSAVFNALLRLGVSALPNGGRSVIYRILLRKAE